MTSLAVPETKLIAPMTVPPGLERWHIDDVKYTKDGKVRLVHHVVWGWMKPKSLYFLEKLHDLFPGANATANSMAHGGYIFKSAVLSTAPSVLGFSLPVGLGLYSWAAINLYNNIKNAKDAMARGDDASGAIKEAIKWGGAMSLPFGDIWLLYKMVEWGANIGGEAAKAIKSVAEQERKIIVSPILPPVNLTP